MKNQPASAEWLAEQIASCLSGEIPVGQEQIARLSRRIVNRLQDRMGGAYVYIPSAIAARQAAIRSEFNGRNARQIADQHGVSLRTVYRLTDRK